MSPRYDLSTLDIGEIGRLMKLLAYTDVEECEIEQGQYSISIRRDAVPHAATGNAEAKSPPQEGQPSGEPRLVRSPAVGIFYRSERRSGPPDIEVGTWVKAGAVLGCIEVMAVPHSVFSTDEGAIEGFLVEDGEPVEYGQPIVAISYQPSAISPRSKGAV